MSNCEFLVFGRDFYYNSYTLSIGDEMEVYLWGKAYPNCVFIKVTRKGFNILNVDTDRCLIRRHVYARKMKDKEYPSKGPIRASFQIPSYVGIKVKDKVQNNVS